MGGFVPEGRLERKRRERAEAAAAVGAELAELVLLGEPNWPPRKEQAPCCLKKRLPDGRPVLGFCSPECIRRPRNWRLVLLGHPIPEGGAE